MSATLKEGRLYEGDSAGKFGRGHFVPVLGDGDNVYLIDSAVLRSGSMMSGESKDDAAIRRCIELSDKNCQYTINATRFDYFKGHVYANGPYKWGDAVEGFDEVCDLHEMRGLKSDEDERWFDPDDKVEHVHLYREHGFDWTYGDIGVTLVREHAVPKIGKRLDAALSDWEPSVPNPMGREFEEIEDIVREMDDAGITLSPLQQVNLDVSRRRLEMLSEFSERYEKERVRWIRAIHHAKMFMNGEAFVWHGLGCDMPEWFEKAICDGAVSVQEVELTINDVSKDMFSCREHVDMQIGVPMGSIVYIQYEQDVHTGNTKPRFGCFDAEWNMM